MTFMILLGLCFIVFWGRLVLWRYAPRLGRSMIYEVLPPQKNHTRVWCSSPFRILFLHLLMVLYLFLFFDYIQVYVGTVYSKHPAAAPWRSKCLSENGSCRRLAKPAVATSNGSNFAWTLSLNLPLQACSCPRARVQEARAQGAEIPLRTVL